MDTQNIGQLKAEIESRLCPYCQSKTATLSIGQYGDGRPWLYAECLSCKNQYYGPEEWLKTAYVVELETKFAAAQKEIADLKARVEKLRKGDFA
jgi:hypothetical protein